ncbi:hypothetical protein FEM48_Zijuj10G0155000 [Ziziphus jujuba var. spinosa]|uniref:CREG-like beta-barrel domain-containing protein n=1 Tax=Ziziphus jujuba var. spinosa TaxID=714518 RepID=A0A978UP75_ZIZJJ|nr:hypothetical protein FEM48_Zijuj10G0155000 [Ziziphus jujuba var. spinosa]
MEALASSVFIPNLPDAYPVVNTSCSCLRTSNKRIGSLKISESGVSSGLRCLALSKEAPESGGGGEGEDGKPLDNGFGSFSEEIVSSSQGNLNRYESSEKHVHEALNTDAPLTSQCGSGTRAGLFRTPISGGVQSATSAHGLPRPALAVRNLMEQARFAHLCTVMSRMHHRREGYPFGSLVDFAPDSMGHPIFSFSPLAIHTRNLLADPRCTLVVQIPGWSGLSNARVTIFGDVYPLEENQQEWAHKQYIAKHQQGPSQQWGNFYYFRMQNIRFVFVINLSWPDL